jgi:hypothetical protein
MAGENTKTTLDTMFKYAVADQVNNLVPSNVVLLKMLPTIQEAEKIGRNYLEPVALSFENGVTYGDGSAFDLNAAVPGVYEEIEVNSSPVVLRSQVSQSAANRMASNKKTFITWATLQAGNMKKSIAKRAEIEMWYGQSGLGTVSAVTNNTTGTEVITFTAASWAPGIWSGMEGAYVEVRDGATGKAGHTSNTLVISVVDFANKAITVVGNATELATFYGTGTAGANCTVYFRGAYSNSMAGIDKQLTNATTLFGINAAAYALWKPNAYACGSAAFSVTKALKAVSLGVGKGGLDSDVKAFVSSVTYENLNSDMAALRALDQSYSKSKAENGSENIVYHCQAGKIEIVPCVYVKEGEAFILPPSGLKRIGAQDITFGTNGLGDKEFFLPLASQAGYELRCQYDFSILHNAPAQCVKVTGIVNS